MIGDVGTHQRPVLARFRWRNMGRNAYLKNVENRGNPHEMLDSVRAGYQMMMKYEAIQVRIGADEAVGCYFQLDIGY